MIAAHVVGKARSIAEGWRSEAERRRKVAKLDAVADALEYCAEELEQGLAMEEDALAGGTLTVEEFAAAAGVTPQTVRTWIRQGELAARRTPHGYAIPRDAERVRRSA